MISPYLTKPLRERPQTENLEYECYSCGRFFPDKCLSEETLCEGGEKFSVFVCFSDLPEFRRRQE